MIPGITSSIAAIREENPETSWPTFTPSFEEFAIEFCLVRLVISSANVLEIIFLLISLKSVST